MPKQNHISAIIFLLAMSCFSCSKDPAALKPETFTVQLGVEREASFIEEGTPMAKVPTADLYGIQVWQNPIGTTASGYSRYAFGVFTDLSKLTIPLQAGAYYKFEATLLVDGANRVGVNSNGTYRAPFTTYNNTYNMNAFNITPDNYLIGLTEGNTQLKEIPGTTFSRPNVDRYYGSVTNYSPNGSPLTIPLKRVVFGLKFIPEGLTEGTLNIQLDGAPLITIAASDSPIEQQEVFCFKGSTSNNSWMEDNYSEKCALTITWTDASSTEHSVGQQSYTFQRRRLYPVRIPLGGTTTPDGDVNLDKEPDTWIEGDEITFTN